MVFHTTITEIIGVGIILTTLITVVTETVGTIMDMAGLAEVPIQLITALRLGVPEILITQ